MTTDIIPRMEDVSKSVADDLADVDAAANLIDSMKIESRVDLDLAVQMTQSIKESHAEIDTKRQIWTKPLNAVVNSINATFRPALDALDVAEDKLKAKIDEFIENSETKRKEILAQVASAPEVERPQLIAKSDALLCDEVKDLVIKRSYRGSLQDESALIRWAIETSQFQYLSANVSTLNQITATLGAKTDIPGWKVEEKRTIAVYKPKAKKK